MPSLFGCVLCVLCMFLSIALQSSVALAQEGAPRVSDAQEESPLDAEQLLGALVEYRTAWHSGRGFLIGDRHTVVVSCLRQRYRRITVREVPKRTTDGCRHRRPHSSPYRRRRSRSQGRSHSRST